MKKHEHYDVKQLHESDLSRAFVIIAQLRTHLDANAFEDCVRRQSTMGYELYGAFDDTELVGVMGIRPVQTPARGLHLHIDDSVVDLRHRRQGVGHNLLIFAEEIALRRKLDRIFLDSRQSVVSFYEGHGYTQHSSILMRKSIL